MVANRCRVGGIVGSMVVVGASAACGGGGGSSLEADCDEDYTPEGTVNVWVHEATTANEVLEELYDDYMSEHPDVTVDMLEVPYADFETTSLQATSAGDGPDLVKLPSWSLPDWADKGLLYPVDPTMVGFADQDALDAAFAPGVFEGVSFEDEAYALPVDYQNLMLYYNKTHFDDAGLDPDAPPETWEDVVDYAEQLTERSGNEITRGGFVWWYTTPIWVYLEVETMAAQLDGSILNDEATEGALGTDAGRAAIEYYLEMSSEHNIASLELVPNGILETFADGNASMMVSGTFSAPSYAAMTEGELSLEADTLGVAPMPTFADSTNDVTAAYSWGWGVTNNADDPCLAGHLARFLTEPAQADRLFGEAGIATPYAGFAESEAATAHEANQILAEQLDRQVFVPPTPEFGQVMTVLTQQIGEGATGAKTPEQVIEDFDNAMRRALR